MDKKGLSLGVNVIGEWLFWCWIRMVNVDVTGDGQKTRLFCDGWCWYWKKNGEWWCYKWWAKTVVLWWVMLMLNKNGECYRWTAWVLISRNRLCWMLLVQKQLMLHAFSFLLEMNLVASSGVWNISFIFLNFIHQQTKTHAQVDPSHTSAE